MKFANGRGDGSSTAQGMQTLPLRKGSQRGCAPPAFAKTMSEPTHSAACMVQTPGEIPHRQERRKSHDRSQGRKSLHFERSKSPIRSLSGGRRGEPTWMR